MADKLTRSDKFGGGALMASGILFALLAFLNFRAGPPPSNGIEILLWRDSQVLVLDFVSEFLFFATALLVPGTFALYRALVDVDGTKAATGCGIIAVAIPVMAVMLARHLSSSRTRDHHPQPGDETRWLREVGRLLRVRYSCARYSRLLSLGHRTGSDARL